MPVLQEELTIQFCAECNQRIRRADATLQNCAAAETQPDCYRRIYQEFDSLYGAARAAGITEWEEFSRVTGLLISRLRGKLPVADQKGQALLDKCIDYSKKCAGNIVHCAILTGPGAQELINEIHDYLKEA